jgi:hypothetical protein
MVINILVGVFLFAVKIPGDSLQDFSNYLEKNIQLYMEPPPEFDSSGTCFHYSELLKISINKYSKVESVNLSDSAPDWLKQRLSKQIENKNVEIKKLDSMALTSGLRNCILVFPLILESEDFPCGLALKKRSLMSNFFKFRGKNLKGKVFFGEQIQIVWPVQYRYKGNVN